MRPVSAHSFFTVGLFWLRFRVLVAKNGVKGLIMHPVHQIATRLI